MRGRAFILPLVISLLNTIPASAQTTPTTITTTSSTQAVVPQLIRFSGVLTDLAGKPVTTTVEVTFSLYKDQTDGQALWYETQTVTPDAEGRYTVLLGAMHGTGLPMEVFTSGEAHWLGVQVGNLPEEPRVLLVSVPYALKAGDAETLGGKPASDYLLSSQSSTNSTTLLSTSSNGDTTGQTTNQTTLTTTTTASGGSSGTQNYIPTFTNNTGSLGNSVMYQNGINIGVGTTASNGKLTIGNNVYTPPLGSSYGQFQMLLYDGGTAASSYGIGIESYNIGFNSGGGYKFYQNGNTNPLMVIGGQGSGNVGIGTTSPQAPLDVEDSYTNLNGNIMSSADVNATLNTTVTNYNFLRGFAPTVTDNIASGAENTGYLIGETVGSLRGGASDLGTEDNLIGEWIIFGNGGDTTARTTKNATGLSIDFFSHGGTTQTVKLLNLYSDAINPATYYGIYQNDGNAMNYFGGSVGIGTNTPTAALEVNGTAKFDQPITFAANQTFPGATFTGNETVQGNVSATGQLVSSAASGTAPLQVASTTQVANLNASFLDGLSASAFLPVTGGALSGSLLVGGTNAQAQNTVLEVQSTPGTDALTVNSSGTVGLGTGTGTHVTTAAPNTDFAGQISINSAASGYHNFATAFANTPVCVVSPTSNMGSVTWYINVSTTQLWIYLSGAATVTFNYICVGNPN